MVGVLSPHLALANEGSRLQDRGEAMSRTIVRAVASESRASSVGSTGRLRWRRLLAVPVSIALLAAPVVGMSNVHAASDTLYAGQTLVPGQAIVSSNGQYQLFMQNQNGYAGDLSGNLVLEAPGGKATWSTTIWSLAEPAYETASYAARVSIHAVMQGDGNFVL